MRMLVLGIVTAVLLLIPISVYAQEDEPNIAKNGNIYMELDFDFEGGNLLPRADTMDIYFRTKNISNFELIPDNDTWIYTGFREGYGPYFYFDNDARVTLDDGQVLVKKVVLYVEIQERQLYDQDQASYWGYGILEIGNNQWPVESVLEVRDEALAYLTVVSSEINPNIDMIYDPIPNENEWDNYWRKTVDYQPTPQPMLFDRDGMRIDLIPYPSENQIEVVINASSRGKYSQYEDIHWRGTVMYGDGDVVSIKGIHTDSILMECNPGQSYTVALQLYQEIGHMSVSILDHENNQIDYGYTDVPYGMIRLVGSCPQ